jgi:AcrR family transcriptional regulator
MPRKPTILTAAREQFATHGYQAATIREIAAAAEIDPAMVMRYFGNKAKLFAAVSEFDLRIPDLRAHPRADVGRALVAHFLARWDGDESLKAMLRTAVTDESVRARLLETFANQLAPVVAMLRGGSGREAATSAGTRRDADPRSRALSLHPRDPERRGARARRARMSHRADDPGLSLRGMRLRMGAMRKPRPALRRRRPC